MGQLSDDGMWEWDGSNWLPTARQGALAQPPPFVPSPQMQRRNSKQAQKAVAAVAREAAKQASRDESDRRAFAASPPGRARTAYARGDHVLQCSFDVMQQQAIIVSMIGSSTSKRTSDPTEILNAVCSEGWELVTGSFVFVEQGQQSRDKFLASGQNVAIKGMTMGYYLFKRCPKNKSAT